MIRLINADVMDGLRQIEDESIHCVVTSPPYWGLRDYGINGQIGLEPTPDEHVCKLAEVFREVWRVLRTDGTVWLNLGDSYARMQEGNVAQTVMKGRVKSAGLKPKDLVGIPWRVAFALQAEGWYLRQDIIWSKPNPMPESVRDRCTKAHEYIFMLSKSKRYYYDIDAIKEPALYGVPNSPNSIKSPMGQGFTRRADKQRGHSRRHAGFNERWDQMTKEEQCSGMRNKRSVWEISTKPFKEAHFATFPPDLIRPCILAGCPEGGTVLDPFGGAGTTALVSEGLGRNSILIELNEKYVEIAKRRLRRKFGMCLALTEGNSHETR